MWDIKQFVATWILPPGVTQSLSKTLARLRVDNDIVPLFMELDIIDNALFGDSRHVSLIDMQKVRYFGGLSYSDNQHHFVKYLNRGIKELENYYASHQPRDNFERHFIFPYVYGAGSAQYDNPQSADFQAILSLPWNACPTEYLGEEGLNENHGHQGFGPVSQEKLSLESKRLTKTFKSIKKQGYSPVLARGHLRGYLLINDEHPDREFRFLVTDGQHRVACLAALGWNEVPVKFQEDQPRAFFLSELNLWPQVRNGTYSIEHARGIFMAYFRDSKTDIERLGQ
jgi:hypothetical protein